jgi:hypothetical protein
MIGVIKYTDPATGETSNKEMNFIKAAAGAIHEDDTTIEAVLTSGDKEANANALKHMHEGTNLQINFKSANAGPSDYMKPTIE